MKIIKYLFFGFSALILLWLGIIFAANNLFSKKLELSCKGTETITRNDKFQNRVPQLRPLEITLTKYPFVKQHIMIKSNLILMISSDEERNSDTNRTVTFADDYFVRGGERVITSASDNFTSINLDRVTRAVEIESSSRYLQTGDLLVSMFVGICEPAKPL